ncbi:MAG: hypothetical protein ABFD82_15910, partial [Syntrophaceae bacterium]
MLPFGGGWVYCPPLEGVQGEGVQTGNIVYKTNRVHGLHYTARRKSSYAVESDKPNGIKNSAC